MSQLQLPLPSVSTDDLEADDFVAPYFQWPHVVRTSAAIAGAVDEVAQLRTYVSRTTLPHSWDPIRVLSVLDRFCVGPIVLRLDDANFQSDLRPLLRGAAGDIFATTSDEAELGAPKVDVLLGAVEDLTRWTGMTKHALSKYLGVSYSTVLSWRREKPERPRHGRIPTLLALWSAVSGAQEEFGADDTARMVWAAGRSEGGLPAIPADELATWLIDETSEANLSEFLTDDGYQAGAAPTPDVEELTAAEGRLHANLETSLAGPDTRTGR